MKIDADGILGLMKSQADPMCALTAALAHVAPEFELHHYPANKMDGKIDGRKFAEGVRSTSSKLGTKTTVAYKVSFGKLSPTTVVQTIHSSGKTADGATVDDLSIGMLEVRDGAIRRGDFVHTNPYGYSQLLQGPSAQTSEAEQRDTAAANRIASAMKASPGRGIEVALDHLADGVASISAEHPESNRVSFKTPMAAGARKEIEALKKAISDWRADEEVMVSGNTVRLRQVIHGRLGGQPFQADSDLHFFVVGEQIVGLQAHHSPQGGASLRKALQSVNFTR